MRIAQGRAASLRLAAYKAGPKASCNTSRAVILSLATFFTLVLLPGVASALVITSAGHYVIDTRVDQVLISDNATSRGVSIEVVSGGVVEGDIRCDGGASDDCEAQVVVSGHGAVLGYIQGADGNVTLRDYAAVGRAGAGSSTGAAVYVSDNAQLGAYQAGTLTLNRLIMTGGYVGSNISTTEGVLVDISDGTIGSFHQRADLIFLMTGGRVLDGISGGGLLVDVRDGAIWGGMFFGSDTWGTSSISGGAFNANANEFLLDFGGFFSPSALTITGGLFGNINQGSGFNFRGSGVVDFWGRDLSLTDGLLTGYLLDGSYISVATTFSPRWTGSFNIYNTPEPGTLALLGLGLLGLGFSRRRKLD